jgi:hypothetical protein
MSALPPKADMFSVKIDVCFVPEADMPLIACRPYRLLEIGTLVTAPMARICPVSLARVFLSSDEHLRWCLSCRGTYQQHTEAGAKHESERAPPPSRHHHPPFGHHHLGNINRSAEIISTHRLARCCPMGRWRCPSVRRRLSTTRAGISSPQKRPSAKSCQRYPRNAFEGQTTN